MPVRGDEKLQREAVARVGMSRAVAKNHCLRYEEAVGGEHCYVSSDKNNYRGNCILHLGFDSEP
jgi:hypothetical protein